MNDKYIYVAIMLIFGMVSIFIGIKFKVPKGAEEYPDITRLKYFMGGGIALFGALLILIFY